MEIQTKNHKNDDFHQSDRDRDLISIGSIIASKEDTMKQDNYSIDSIDENRRI